ncbi:MULTISPECIES: transporter substrate-binding domain-containing protein [unclassified Brenneria]|uniref:transporter substrate-binding domain-containing protein n=1 Tax=unclassified Brenneria TaxID=2634434 RepID=UPI0015540BB1|nr:MULTISPECIES: transporter substrate-binding domain-containing protein [unclassified Brenneria]MBJ7222959.1 transporter substrate-binding domain-containing protein [Brenneria sp. L3-3C-1]MEE3644198.1 transporter substrate-binding domain-containing protein [Brenneria sp. L3_3C_1]MEE3652422.1 transporter substrate-binding domain-containing protein [Brenneria sp. HEZEL_4_2_4]NPD02379.1 transporter substrate-binding domain-containing protein [Brenneria sp. hezel4-2-4]
MMKSKLKMIACSLCLVSTLAAAFTASAEEKKWSTIRIATEGNYHPYNFTKPDGTLDGFEIDMYKVLCESMQVKCDIIVQPFTSTIPALNAGKFDAIISGMSATEKRRQVIDFSQPYTQSGQTFAVLKSSPLAKELPDAGKRFSINPADEAVALEEIEKLKPLLQGKTIGVQSASIASAFLDKYLKGVMTIREYKTTQEHDLDLKAGRVDLVIASAPYLKGITEKPGNTDIVTPGPQFIGGILGSGSSVGLRKTDPELKAMFNTAIEQAKNDGTLKKLSEKWFGMDTSPL